MPMVYISYPQDYESSDMEKSILNLLGGLETSTTALDRKNLEVFYNSVIQANEVVEIVEDIFTEFDVENASVYSE